jgi:hypothetical protein
MMSGNAVAASRAAIGLVWFGLVWFAGRDPDFLFCGHA